MTGIQDSQAGLIMAGRPPGIAQTLRTRQKIQASALVNRLHKCVMGEVELTAQQVNAAKTLLNKVLPDLQSISMEAVVESRRSADEFTDAELAAIASGGSGTDSGEAASQSELH